MTCELKHALGREEKFFAAVEAVCNEYAKPVSANALKVLATTFDFDQERVERTDKEAATRSRRERITRRKTIGFSVESYLNLSGSAGVLPDIHPLLYSAFGSFTNDYTTITYALQNSQQLPSLQLTREASRVVQQVLNAARVNELTLAGSGGEEVRVTASGLALSHAFAFRADVGTTDGVNARVALSEANDYKRFEANTLIAFELANGTIESNGGAGYQITSVNEALNRLNLDAIPPALASVPVVPFTPAETTAGSPATAIIGTFRWDGDSYPVTSWSVALRNNYKELNDEFGQDGPTGHLSMIRDVEVNATFRLRRDQAIHWTRATRFETRQLQIFAGSLASGGNRARLVLPAVEFNIPPIDIPEEEEVLIDATGVALQSSTPEDEYTLIID